MFTFTTHSEAMVVLICLKKSLGLFQMNSLCSEINFHRHSQTSRAVVLAPVKLSLPSCGASNTDPLWQAYAKILFSYE